MIFQVTAFRKQRLWWIIPTCPLYIAFVAMFFLDPLFLVNTESFWLQVDHVFQVTQLCVITFFIGGISAGKAIFWRYYFFVDIINYLISLLYMLYDSGVELYDVHPNFIALLTSVYFYSVIYLILWLYAFESKAIWESLMQEPSYEMDG